MSPRLLSEPLASRQSAATTGASAGTSCMHEELSSINPGDARTSPVVIVAAVAPFIRLTSRKTEDNSSSADPTVSSRGARIEGETCLRIRVRRNAYSGGWSFQISVYNLYPLRHKV